MTFNVSIGNRPTTTVEADDFQFKGDFVNFYKKLTEDKSQFVASFATSLVVSIVVVPSTKTDDPVLF